MLTAFCRPGELSGRASFVCSLRMGPPPMLELLIIVGLLVGAIVLPVFMVRGLIQMYRDKDRSGTFSSGVAGMMTEIDRVVRPSVQHIIEVKESDESHRDDIGADK
jgi:hypothetical protein